MGAKRRRLPFRYLEPAFFSGLLDDPLLFVRIRPLQKALLFDCGQITHLAKRVIKPIEAVFITHAHMDHVMGVPTLVRHRHAAPRPVDMYGPPGIAERIGSLLRGFEWNLSEPGWFTLAVHEVRQDHITHHRFCGPDGFSHHVVGEDPRVNKVIWSCPYATVEAELLDHKLPVLAFRIQEQPFFSIDRQEMARQGLASGEWLRHLKLRVVQGGGGRTVHVPHQAGEEEKRELLALDYEKLYDTIRDRRPSASIGYVCDVGWTAENRANMANFLREVTLLCSDCTFLAADTEKARASFHLCTDDLNQLAAQLSPLFLLPMHLSKSYLRRTTDLYRELVVPEGTTILPLPPHLVPPPLTVSDVSDWLRIPGR